MKRRTKTQEAKRQEKIMARRKRQACSCGKWMPNYAIIMVNGYPRMQYHPGCKGRN